LVIKRFEFSTAQKIIFEIGSFKLIHNVLQSHWKNILLLISQSTNLKSTTIQILQENGFEVLSFFVKGEPTDQIINRITLSARKFQCDAILAVGGGSVIDAAKAVSAMVTNQGNLLDYLEVVGKGKPIKNKPKPLIAVPTTAGTGSEVTKNAVIKVIEKNVKVSMRNDFLLPEVALIDPELTFNLPPDITASTGMDAFIQVLEPYVSKGSNSFVDLFCREGIVKASKSILEAYHNGKNKEARVNMSWVSLLGGLSLANAKLGAVHGFAGPIGGMYDAPHGVICASLLPAVVQINVSALSRKEKDHAALKRYKEIFNWVTQIPNSKVSEGVEWFKKLNKVLKIPSLHDIGVKREDFPQIIEKSKKSSSMRGNPIHLSEEELFLILETAY